MYCPPDWLTLTRLPSDHDELRYSIRSVMDNFQSPGTRFHLLTTDFAIPDAYANKSNITDPELWRLGQLPQWLDCDRRVGQATWRDGDHELVVAHHAQFFRPYNGTVFNRWVAPLVKVYMSADSGCKSRDRITTGTRIRRAQLLVSASRTPFRDRCLSVDVSVCT